MKLIEVARSEKIRDVQFDSNKRIISHMKPRILDIFKQLGEFGSHTNQVWVEELDHIAQTTVDDTERDQAIVLMLFCEANENGPLGMSPLTTFTARYGEQELRGT